MEWRIYPHHSLLVITTFKDRGQLETQDCHQRVKIWITITRALISVSSQNQHFKSGINAKQCSIRTLFSKGVCKVQECLSEILPLMKTRLDMWVRLSNPTAPRASSHSSIKHPFPSDLNPLILTCKLFSPPINLLILYQDRSSKS